MNKNYLTIFTIISIIILGVFIAKEVQAAVNVPLTGDYEWNCLGADSCGFPEEVNGVENGNLTIGISGMIIGITSNQTFVWNTNYSIIIDKEKGGYIAINKGSNSQIRKAYICMKDEDNDKYPHGTTGMVVSNSSICLGVTGGKRRSHSDFTNKWTYVHQIQWDYDDTKSSVYPGTNCGLGNRCDKNSDAGTCVVREAGCLPESTPNDKCKYCNGSQVSHLNCDSGKYCSGGIGGSCVTGDCDYKASDCCSSCVVGKGYYGCGSGLCLQYSCVEEGRCCYPEYEIYTPCCMIDGVCQSEFPCPQ